MRRTTGYQKPLVMFAITVFCAVIGAFAEPVQAVYRIVSNDYGLSRATVNGARSSLSVAASGMTADSYGVLGVVGGVLLQGKANWPTDWWTRAWVALCPSNIHYDPGAHNGARLVIHLGCQEYRPSLPDEFFTPVAKFADSGYQSIVTLYGSENNPSEEEQNAMYRARIQSDSGRIFHVQYHPQAIDTLLGAVAFVADSMFVTDDDGEFVTMQMRRSIQSWNADALFRSSSGESFDEEKSRSVALKMTSTVRDVMTRQFAARDLEESQHDDYREICSKGSVGYVLTDRATHYTVQFSSTISLGGWPYYSFWYCRVTANSAPEAVHINTISLSRLVELNPYVYGVLAKAGQWSAFFRSFKDQYSDHWRDFMNELTSAQVAAVETPTFWEPPASLQ